MKFAVVAEALSADARTAARSAREMGFAGLLFNAYSPALSIPELSQTGRREFRQVLSTQEIQLVGLSGDVGPKGFGPGADVDRLIDRIDLAMESAAGLASPLLCLEIGPLVEPPRKEKPKPAITPELAGLIILPTTNVAPEPSAPPQRPIDTALQATIHAALQEIAARAERYSVTIALSSALSSLAALESVILATRCPWFGVDLDPVAILRDEWDMDEAFSHLGSFIRHVRARDALAGTDRRTKPAIVGQGSVDWPSLLAHLDQSGYNGWLTIDSMELTDRALGATQALKQLQKHLP